MNPPARCMRCRHEVPALRSPYPNVVQLLPVCEYCTGLDLYDSAQLLAAVFEKPRPKMERRDG